MRKIEYHTFIDVISINVANIHGLENAPAHPVPIVNSFFLILTWIDLHCVLLCLYWEYICANLNQLSKIIVFRGFKLAMVDCFFCFLLVRFRLLMKEGGNIVPTYVAKISGCLEDSQDLLNLLKLCLQIIIKIFNI